MNPGGPRFETVSTANKLVSDRSADTLNYTSTGLLYLLYSILSEDIISNTTTGLHRFATTPSPLGYIKITTTATTTPLPAPSSPLPPSPIPSPPPAPYNLPSLSPCRHNHPPSPPTTMTPTDIFTCCPLPDLLIVDSIPHPCSICKTFQGYGVYCRKRDCRKGLRETSMCADCIDLEGIIKRREVFYDPVVGCITKLQ
ncbi:hypothetical protein EX30DRAFT_273270 [Ascodesmis nigricans]|uniref:Uncharacterized protein n=1 Tax=Ascodesmis nigricans TaxID=341454 RepID=A0A4S2MXK8_9PEZI|nr:hypothetical protein EX30DRAFT_273270 [Ascodesmis nigricans]